MLLLVLLFVLVAFGLLVIAVVSSVATWAWGSVLASLLAAGLLIADVIRRRGRERASRSGQAGRSGRSAAAPAPSGPHGSSAPGSPSSGFAPGVHSSGPGQGSPEAAGPASTAPPPVAPPVPPLPGGGPLGGGAPSSAPSSALSSSGPAPGSRWVTTNTRPGSEPSRVAGAPRGARLLGMLPMPGTPAEARLGGGPAPVPSGPGAPARDAPGHPGGDDAATTRLDAGDLARMRQVPEAQHPDGAPPGAPPAGAPHGPPPAQPPPGRPPAGPPPGQGGPPPGGMPPGAAPPPPPPASQPEEEDVDDAARQAMAGHDDEVLVIDEEPLFHLGRCSYLYGREVIPLPASEAVELGFTGCSWCTPVAALAGPRSADTRR